MVVDIPVTLSDPHPQVCFIACHPTGGSHFADFFYALSKEGRVSCLMLASEKAAEELQKRGVSFQNFYAEKTGPALKDLDVSEQEKLAENIAHLCQHAQCVITDLGHSFSTKIQTKLAKKYPLIRRVAYYDNPEAFVPGGYSTTAATTIKVAQTILFANAKLANLPLYSLPSQEIDFTDKQKIGLGYANLRDIEELQAKRNSPIRASIRSNLMHQRGLTCLDDAISLGVYFGGANEVYYQEAFPHFLAILHEAAQMQDLSRISIIIQQHPRSIVEGNRDGKALEEWKKTAPSSAPHIAISSMSFNDALIAADFALYYQTGAASKFMMLGLPTAQIGHEAFPDILVRNHFCPAITNVKQFLFTLDTLRNGILLEEELQKRLVSESGIDPHWPEKLCNAVELTKE